MKNKLKLQNIIKHIKTMFYNLVSGQFKKSQIDTISNNSKNDNINLYRLINYIMKKIENVYKKICRFWKHVWVLFIHPMVLFSVIISIISVIFKDTNPNFTNILDFIFKFCVGIAVTTIINELYGHKDIIKLLRSYNYTTIRLRKIIQESETDKKDIENIIDHINWVTSEFRDDYDFSNIENEIKNIEQTKENIQKLENANNTSEKEILVKNLSEQLDYLEKQGFSDIRGATGTTETYYYEIKKK